VEFEYFAVFLLKYFSNFENNCRYSDRAKSGQYGRLFLNQTLVVFKKNNHNKFFFKAANTFWVNFG
jgi:hypothetical protein